METEKYVRGGFGTVRPYIYGPATLLDFVQQTFGAEVVERTEDGRDVQVRIGDSIIALDLAENPPPDDVTRGSIYVYVEDVDETYRLALRAGATSIKAPRDRPFRDRLGGVTDTFGNRWLIATYLGPS